MSSKGVTPVIATALLIGIALSTVVTASLFMENTLKDVKSGFSQDIKNEEIRQKAEMNIEYGYNRSSYLLIDVRNTGDVALPLKEDGEDLISLYVDGRPDDTWNYLGSKTTLSREGTVTINTTENFPEKGNYTEIEVNGAYETSSAIVCYNDGSSTC